MSRHQLAVMALDHILSALVPGCGSRTVRALLAAALEGDEAAAGRLAELGVRVREQDNGVAFAHATPFMRELFKDRPHPIFHLSGFDGSLPLDCRSFGSSRSRSVLVPMADVENQVYGTRD